MIVSGTGHRPPRLGLSYSAGDFQRLVDFLVGSLREFPYEIDTIWCGGAQGFDQALAEAARYLCVPYRVALPFEGMDDRWPAESRERFRGLLQGATDVVVVCPGGYAPEKFIKRDYYLVDHCDCLMTLHDGNWASKSGTGHTIEYAMKRNKPIYGLWEEFFLVRDSTSRT